MEKKTKNKMKKDIKYQIIFAGPAGSGPNFIANLFSELLNGKGYYVFNMRNYSSLIRGGNNFNVLTFSNKRISSNESKSDILVALDEKSIKIHKNNLKKDSFILSSKNKQKNIYFLGQLVKYFGLEFFDLQKQLKVLGKKYEDNLSKAKQGYESIKTSKFDLRCNEDNNLNKNNNNNLDNKNNNLNNNNNKNNLYSEDGSQGVSQGALKSGLDLYYAYPMTPATPVLVELAQATLNKNAKHKTVELENEIAVANAGVGSCISGKKTMVGTSGGGFDLMSETLSLCGMAGIPLIFYLAMRKGPSTGVATYTTQEDLKMALGTGHGEFPRIVVSPGNPLEAEEVTNQMFYLCQKFSTPGIILSDKHLAESYYTLDKKSELIKVPQVMKLKRYNSYEQNPKTGSATENPGIIKNNTEERFLKINKISSEIKNKKFAQYKIYGNKNSKNVIISWGSNQGAILDSIKNLKDICFISLIYLEPFPSEIKKYLEKARNILVIENSRTCYIADLIKQKIGFEIPEKNKILRYDSRAFLSDELNKEIKKRLN
ncbi:MAG: 2-oxoacid:acceptor oxidoreductase family protein [Nanoarchaeota archaeon]